MDLAMTPLTVKPGTKPTAPQSTAPAREPIPFCPTGAPHKPVVSTNNPPNVIPPDWCGTPPRKAPIPSTVEPPSEPMIPPDWCGTPPRKQPTVQHPNTPVANNPDEPTMIFCGTWPRTVAPKNQPAQKPNTPPIWWCGTGILNKLWLYLCG